MDTQDVCRTFANNLKFQMDKAGMSQRELGDAIGVVHSAVSDWVNAKRVPRTPILQKMQSVFGCELSDLLLPMEDRVDSPTVLTEAEAEIVRLFRSAPVSKRESILNLLR